ncbi:MAG: putative membrane protein insertion efficiency factor [Oceanospirillaceae bacterium]|jgi:putative membrane protein insertion efficiency factor
MLKGLFRIKTVLSSCLSAIFLLLIKVYQYAISPMLGNNCRFYPTCSSYTKEAIEIHGPFKGVWLAVKRIVKCHPYHDGGVDLVPESPEALSNDV